MHSLITHFQDLSKDHTLVMVCVLELTKTQTTLDKKMFISRYKWPMSSERDSFAKGIFSTFAKGFLLHKLLLKVNYSPLRVKKSRSHDMGQCSYQEFL
jgi:hypothetical protein